MKVYSIVNHFAKAVYACSSLEDAKESLSCELEAIKDLRHFQDFAPWLSFTTGQIVDISGYVYCEIQTLEVETEWNLEMLTALQHANNL